MNAQLELPLASAAFPADALALDLTDGRAPHRLRPARLAWDYHDWNALVPLGRAEAEARADATPAG
jgi:hypothetical protein